MFSGLQVSRGYVLVLLCVQPALYLLDEPIGGVDPAARDYILRTILTNYNEQGSILISTHLISDVEKVLDFYQKIVTVLKYLVRGSQR